MVMLKIWTSKLQNEFISIYFFVYVWILYKLLQSWFTFDLDSYFFFFKIKQLLSLKKNKLLMYWMTDFIKGKIWATCSRTCQQQTLGSPSQHNILFIYKKLICRFCGALILGQHILSLYSLANNVYSLQIYIFIVSHIFILCAHSF